MAIALTAASAHAQSAPLDIAEDATWDHRWTDFIMPPTLGNWIRNDIKQFGENEVDVAGGYSQDATRSWVTIYIYRPGLNDVSVWHDRAVTQILANSGWTGVDRERMSTRFFTPANGAGENSAIVSVMPVGGNLTGTGVALIPHGEWIVKIRMSSGVLDPAMIDAELGEMIDRLDFGRSDRTYEPAYLVQPCEDALPTRRTKRIDSDAAGALLSAIAESTSREKIKEERDENGIYHVDAPTYCRDRTGDRMWSAYQPDGNRKRYIVAIADAGIALRVGRDELGSLLGDRKPRYNVTLLDKMQTSNYRPFSRLPGPEQAVSVVMREGPVSTSGRALGEDSEEDTTVILSPE